MMQSDLGTLGQWKELYNNNNNNNNRPTFKLLPGLAERSATRDKERLQQTVTALEQLGVTDTERDQIFQVLLAILYLGNIEFTQGSDDDSADISHSPVSGVALEAACSLLQLECSQVRQVLLHRNIQSGRGGSRQSTFVKPVRHYEAASRRDCLATLLYSTLFDWLVSYINEQLDGGGSGGQHSIGLLDIYGFECFPANSLEQLCINYANERLQLHYVQHFLQHLQAEYLNEDLEWSYTEFQDNQSNIETLDGQCGVFGILNEEVYLNRPNKDPESLTNRLSEVTAGLSPLDNHQHHHHHQHQQQIHHYDYDRSSSSSDGNGNNGNGGG
ncbi:hypothetical protein Ahia01_001330000, partial [Argonauta hians]